MTLHKFSVTAKPRGEVLAWFCLQQAANDLHMLQLMPLPPP